MTHEDAKMRAFLRELDRKGYPCDGMNSCRMANIRKRAIKLGLVTSYTCEGYTSYWVSPRGYDYLRSAPA